MVVLANIFIRILICSYFWSRNVIFAVFFKYFLGLKVEGGPANAPGASALNGSYGANKADVPMLTN